MPLAKTSLTFPLQVGAGQTLTVYQVGSAKTAYVKSILLYNLSSTGSQNVQIHMVKNSGGSVGVASTGSRIARIGIATDDTFFFEPAYPLTLNATGDSIQIFNEGITANSINVTILGDREL